MTRVAGPLEVLFAIPALDQGGPDRVLFELICSLDRRDFTPSLLVSEPGGHYLERLPTDVSVTVLGGGRSLLDRYPVVRALRFIRRTKPDVVLATLRMTLTLGLAAPAFPRRTRLILRQANDLTTDYADLVKRSLVKHRLARQVTLATLRRADAVVCQSEAMRHDLRAQLGDRARLHVISNPIDVERVAQATRGEPTLLPGQPALISVGRLAPQKGYDVLLPALALVRRTHPAVHLTILGDGPDRAALGAQAQALDLARSITFAGFTAHPLPAVRAADVFVLASRYEGFPNAALEALALGTPVVLTDCPGANREIIEPGVNGRLASAVTPEAVARALEAAIADGPRYDRAAIRADCEHRFGARRIAGRYEDMFRAVAEA